MKNSRVTTMQVIQAKISIINERLDALENEQRYVYERLDSVDKNHAGLRADIDSTTAVSNMQRELSRKCDQLLGSLAAKVDRAEMTESLAGIAARTRRTERDCEEALNRLDRYVSRLENLKRDLVSRH